jgi:predicted permease
MPELLISLTPVFLFFGLGLLLRTLGFADTSHARFLLKFVFYISLPCLVLLKISETTLTQEKIALPFINIAVNLACMFVTLLVARLKKIDRRTLGSMLVSTMIVNNVFMFPFILAGYGDDAFADAVLFDFGNAVMSAGFTYGLSFRYGPEGHTTGTLIAKTLRSPLVWALVLAVTFSTSATEIPRIGKSFLAPLGQMTSPLILISLGLFFSPKMEKLMLVTIALAIRIFVGIAIGAGIAMVLGLSGMTFAVVVLCSAAPVGFNALIFSSLAELDTEFAANILSISVFLGVLYIPVLMYLFQL